MDSPEHNISLDISPLETTKQPTPPTRKALFVDVKDTLRQANSTRLLMWMRRNTASTKDHGTNQQCLYNVPHDKNQPRLAAYIGCIIIINLDTNAFDTWIGSI